MIDDVNFMIYDFMMQNECLDNIDIYQKIESKGSCSYVSKKVLNLTIINLKN